MRNRIITGFGTSLLGIVSGLVQLIRQLMRDTRDDS